MLDRQIHHYQNSHFPSITRSVSLCASLFYSPVLLTVFVPENENIFYQYKTNT